MTDLRICFFGDSIVAGARDPACMGWVGRLCEKANREGHVLTAYNLGIRHDTSADIAARWEIEAARRLPPLHDGRLVFSFGINDTMIEEGTRRLSFDESIEITTGILRKAASRYPTLFVGPPPVTDDAENIEIERLSAAFAALSGSLNVPYLDTFKPLLAVEAWRESAAAVDGYHPLDDGYAAFAEVAAAWPAWRAWLTGVVPGPNH